MVYLNGFSLNIHRCFALFCFCFCFVLIFVLLFVRDFVGGGGGRVFTWLFF